MKDFPTFYIPEAEGYPFRTEPYRIDRIDRYPPGGFTVIIQGRPNSAC